MKLLALNLLLCIFAFIISLNAEYNTGKVFMADGALEMDEVPRVKITVFRGPTEEQEGEEFTKWGFLIKQPVKI